MYRRSDSEDEDPPENNSLVVKVIDVPDLVNLIADYCDEESISKLSRVCLMFSY
jgi:hypothetical protein